MLLEMRGQVCQISASHLWQERLSYSSHLSDKSCHVGNKREGVKDYCVMPVSSVLETKGMHRC